MEQKIPIANLSGLSRRKALDDAVKQLLQHDGPGEIRLEHTGKSISFVGCAHTTQVGQPKEYVSLLSKHMLEVV